MSSLVLRAGAAAFACAILAGCSANASLNPTATNDVQQALAIGCPILSAVQSSSLSLNKYQQSALNVLDLACPPNPSPTSALIAIGDIIAAYTALKPLLKP